MVYFYAVWVMADEEEIHPRKSSNIFSVTEENLICWFVETTQICRTSIPLRKSIDLQSHHYKLQNNKGGK